MNELKLEKQEYENLSDEDKLLLFNLLEKSQKCKISDEECLHLAALIYKSLGLLQFDDLPTIRITDSEEFLSQYLPNKNVIEFSNRLLNGIFKERRLPFSEFVNASLHEYAHFLQEKLWNPSCFSYQKLTADSISLFNYFLDKYAKVDDKLSLEDLAYNSYLLYRRKALFEYREECRKNGEDIPDEVLNGMFELEKGYIDRYRESGVEKIKKHKLYNARVEDYKKFMRNQSLYKPYYELAFSSYLALPYEDAARSTGIKFSGVFFLDLLSQEGLSKKLKKWIQNDQSQKLIEIAKNEIFIREFQYDYFRNYVQYLKKHFNKIDSNQIFENEDIIAKLAYYSIQSVVAQNSSPVENANVICNALTSNKTTNYKDIAKAILNSSDDREKQEASSMIYETLFSGEIVNVNEIRHIGVTELLSADQIKQLFYQYVNTGRINQWFRLYLAITDCKLYGEFGASEEQKNYIVDSLSDICEVYEPMIQAISEKRKCSPLEYCVLNELNLLWLPALFRDDKYANNERVDKFIDLVRTTFAEFGGFASQEYFEDRVRENRKISKSDEEFNMRISLERFEYQVSNLYDYECKIYGEKYAEFMKHERECEIAKLNKKISQITSESNGESGQ